jgi:hypothetical protein
MIICLESEEYDSLLNCFVYVVLIRNGKMPVKVQKELKYALRHKTTARTTTIMPKR